MLKEIRDIGIAAYLVMHEYKLRDKKDKSFLFEVVSDETTNKEMLANAQKINFKRNT